MRVAVSCGGTGGHMFPGLAVARELLARGHRVAVILSGRDVEGDRGSGDLPEGAETIQIPSRPLTLRHPGSAFGLVKALLRARRAFAEFRPDAVLAMGAYTSFAPVVAARLHLRDSRRIPVVLHEANAIPGSAVAHLARFASTVCVCFPGMERHFPAGKRLADTGLPLRAAFALGMGGAKADPSRFSILVMGGSQGARSLNDAVVALASELQRRAGLPPVRIVHLAGARNEADVRAAYAAAALDPARVAVEVVGFEHDMARRYAEADLCISRAGASSCFELALAGLPALFVPLRGLANDHQVRNAEAMASRGAGLLPGNLDADLVAGLATDPARRAALRDAALALARPDAAARVADEVERAAAR